MVAPGFPSKLKDPLPSHVELFHNATVGAKNVHWEPVCDLVVPDIIYREVSRTALVISDIVFVPFLDVLFEALEVTIPNDAGVDPEKPDFWENEGSWPLPDDTLACGETWRDIIDDNDLDGGIDDGVWDCWREWIALELNRAAGVIVPQVVLDVQTALLAIIEDCVVTGAEEDDFDDYCEIVEKFNDNDNNGIGYTRLLGTFPSDCAVAFSYLVWRLSYVPGLDVPRLLAVTLPISMVCAVVDLFSDPDDAALAPDYTLLMSSADDYLYTLRDAIQLAVEQRPQLS